jgi:hypothetical protein
MGGRSLCSGIEVPFRVRKASSARNLPKFRLCALDAQIPAADITGESAKNELRISVSYPPKRIMLRLFASRTAVQFVSESNVAPPAFTIVHAGGAVSPLA